VKRSRTSSPSAPKDPVANFVFSGGAPYADKSEYISKDLAFTVAAITFEPGRGFDGQDRWALTVEPEDNRGQEILTFGCNDKRDDQLKVAQEHISRHGPIVGVRLKRSGKAYYLAKGSADGP
jgi:hypothetical protein